MGRARDMDRFEVSEERRRETVALLLHLEWRSDTGCKVLIEIHVQLEGTRKNSHNNNLTGKELLNQANTVHLNVPYSC